MLPLSHHGRDGSVVIHLATLVHPENSAGFPCILMNGDGEERNLGLDDQDETDEEVIRRVSQTTGVPAHGAGLTYRSAGRRGHG